MDKNINYYLIFLIIFSWQGLFFGAHQESAGNNHWLYLPTDVHLKIAQFIFENDMALFAPHARDTDCQSEKIHFRLYDHFIKKGFFPNTLNSEFLDPQQFNNFRFVNKCFFRIADSISYENKLKIWYEKRIVLDSSSEEMLFNRLLDKKANNQISIISTALNFFGHHNLMRNIYYYSSDFLFFECFCKEKHYGLANFPFVSVIFYTHLLISYKKLNSKIQEDCALKKSISLVVQHSSLFCYVSDFDFEWLEKFLYFSLSLLKKNISNQPSTDQNVLEKFSQLEESFLQSNLESKIKIFSNQELILFLIEHYSVLEINNTYANEFAWYKKDWLKKFSSGEQKIIWFYYVNALHKQFISLNNDLPYFDFPELLAAIEEWLQETYPQAWLRISDTSCKNYNVMNTVELLGYLIQNAMIEASFDANLLFKVLNFILHLEGNFVNIINNIMKEDEEILNETFFEAVSKKCFETVASENKEYDAHSAFDNQSGEKSVNKKNASDSKDGEPQNYNESTNTSITKNVTSDDDLSKDKQLTFYDKTKRLKKKFFYCVTSVLACCILYKLWYHVKNYKFHYV